MPTVQSGGGTSSSSGAGKDPASVASLERMSAVNRLGRVEDIADVLHSGPVTPRSITGQNIRVHGGTV